MLLLTSDNQQSSPRPEASNHWLESYVRARTIELEAANVALLRLHQEKDEFLGFVAHDLRGLLNSILLCVELLRTRTSAQQGDAHLHDLLEESTHKAISFLNDLLDLAAIEAGQFKLERTSVEIAPLIARVSRLNRLIGEHKGIQLSVMVAEGLLPAWLDPNRLEQVITNLLSNAFKYSPVNTTVFLQVWCEQQDLLLAVTDEGQGIPPEEVEHIFEHFYRASVHPTAVERSSGIGLAICKRIVDLHGGEISVYSVVGQGSRFTVRFPNAVSLSKCAVAQ